MTTFTDDFNRADSTSLGANWVEVSGDWSIVSNQLSPGAAGGTIILRAAGAMATNDHSAQFTITATAAASQGVWCRGNSNISQGYLWRNNGTSWDLFSVVGGSFTNIGTYAAAAAPGDIAKVQALGSTIKGYVGGVERVSVTNTAVTTGTSVGIRADSAGALRFDDFAATDVSAGATLGIASSTETAQPLTGTKAAGLGVATETAGAQVLAGAKAGALDFAGAAESAQPLASGKTAPLSPAASLDTAQPATGVKTGALTFAATPESAQELTGTKTAPLGSAATIEAAQALFGSKTAAFGTALEDGTTQVIAGAKTDPLPVAAQTETAQALAVAVNRSLGPAACLEAAQPLAGAKSATLGPAVETSAARSVVTVGPDEDVDVAVGAPYSLWSAGVARSSGWEASAPW